MLNQLNYTTLCCWLQVVARLTDGTGSFAAETMLVQLPADLGIDAAKARKVVEEQAKDRKRTQLVQVGGGGGGEEKEGGRPAIGEELPGLAEWITPRRLVTDSSSELSGWWGGRRLAVRPWAV